MSESDDDGEDGATHSRMGRAPVVAGSDQMRAKLAEALFGGSGDSPPPWDHETDGDADTRLAHDAPARSDLDDEEAVGERIGRFRILERLGRGGMGVVYAAYDPELDRRVAIKVLRPELHRGVAAEDARARLLREAQAMARVVDPHVIVVHDVGTVGERVFVAMEFVEGVTLGQWIKQRRPWRQVLATFVRAGSGLAAAHRAGLVHRDFKPDNVLVGVDGRLRVLDFGLARSVGDDDRTTDARRGDEQQPLVDSLANPLTRTGAVMGTPAYMSPEQHLGQPADARSDQFSFCVALYEGLFGRRPFAGDTLAVLSANVVAGKVRPPPSEARVPRRVIAAVERGLSVNPDDRFANMDGLLVALGRDPARRWKIGGLAAAGFAVAVGLGVFGSRNVIAGQCDGVAARMDEVWNDARRESVRAAIEASGESWAPRSAESALQQLDRWAGQWRERTTAACAAALVGGGEQAWADAERCFDDRRAELDQLVQVLGEGGTAIAATAVQAAVGLSDLDACEDAERAKAWAAMADEAAQTRLAEARARLGRAKATGAMGRWDEAMRLSTEVVADARQLDVPSLEAAGLLERGHYRGRTGDLVRAEEDLQRAVERSVEAGDQRMRAQALVRLVFVVSRDADRYDEARRFGVQATEVVQRLGDDPLLQAMLDGALGAAARTALDHETALEHSRRALQLHREILGDEHPDTIRMLANVGTILSALGRLDEAEDHLRRAEHGFSAVLGAEHPEMGTILKSLGNCLARQRRFEEALQVQDRALAVSRKALSPDDPRLLSLEYNVAKIFADLGDHAEAIRRLRDGLPRAEQALGREHRDLNDWYATLGECLEKTGEFHEAQVAYGRALEIRKDVASDVVREAKLRFSIVRTKAHEDLPAALAMARETEAELSRKLAREGDHPAWAPGLLQDLRAWIAERETASP